MKGHTQKYYMCDNYDWPNSDEAGTHLIYPVTTQLPAGPFFAGSIFTDDQKAS